MSCFMKWKKKQLHLWIGNSPPPHVCKSCGLVFASFRAIFDHIENTHVILKTVSIIFYITCKQFFTLQTIISNHPNLSSNIWRQTCGCSGWNFFSNYIKDHLGDENTVITKKLVRKINNNSLKPVLFKTVSYIRFSHSRYLVTVSLIFLYIHTHLQVC